jgi:hypothetical protein
MPYVRDDRETPLCVGRDEKDVEVIWVKREPEYFCRRGWTGFFDLPAGQTDGLAVRDVAVVIARSEATTKSTLNAKAGLLRFARNDGLILSAACRKRWARCEHTRPPHPPIETFQNEQ